jgi:nitrous oxidase accessory protein NosD
MTLSSVSTMTIRNCVMTANLTMSKVNTITVTDSAFNTAVLIESDSTNVDIVANTFTMTGTGLAEAIYLQNGTGNQVRQNTMTGGYDGSLSKTGTDDGIVLENETGDNVEGNAISGFYAPGSKGSMPSRTRPSPPTHFPTSARPASVRTGVRIGRAM